MDPIEVIFTFPVKLRFKVPVEFVSDLTITNNAGGAAPAQTVDVPATPLPTPAAPVIDPATGAVISG